MVLCCDNCNRSYHLSCLGRNGIPLEDTWLCPECGGGDKVKKSATTCMAVLLPEVVRGFRRWSWAILTINT